MTLVINVTAEGMEEAKEQLRELAALSRELQVERIAIAPLQPGDTIVLTAQFPLAAEHARRLQDDVEARFPDNRVLVLDEGMDLSVVAGEQNLLSATSDEQA